MAEKSDSSRWANKSEIPATRYKLPEPYPKFEIKPTWGRRKAQPFIEKESEAVTRNWKGKQGALPLTEVLGEGDLLKETADDGVSLEGGGGALNEGDHNYKE